MMREIIGNKPDDARGHVVGDLTSDIG